ncbi:hypothetical protein [Endozoicomonas arenosclerae]|uniref:hypothetical protein n=1 Tax=Endozoicomonas arenosclerae TaxID=1633495 RepID=UPI000ADBAC1B|nr:hypothetical protein [Endozoicomonas arenosclerae]
MPETSIQNYQRRAIYHGCIAILIGLLSGFGLMYNILSEIPLGPFANLPVDIPGEPSLWRGAHTGPILNGVFAIALALSLSLVSPDPKTARRISHALILTVWGNVIFYMARILGTNRGLAFHSEQFGQGNGFDILAFMSAGIAIFTGIYAIVKLLGLLKRSTKATTGGNHG